MTLEGGGGYQFTFIFTHSQQESYTHSAPKHTPEVVGLLCQQFYLPALNPVREKQKIKRIEYHEGVLHARQGKMTRQTGKCV